ncbi:hypothetical protein Efla_004553 [Eimeria flavescens]
MGHTVENAVASPAELRVVRKGAAEDGCVARPSARASRKLVKRKASRGREGSGVEAEVAEERQEVNLSREVTRDPSAEAAAVRRVRTIAVIRGLLD